MNLLENFTGDLSLDKEEHPYLEVVRIWIWI